MRSWDGNDGELYGYFVRFDEDNDSAILAELGLEPGEFLREVSINAFDAPDYNRHDFAPQEPPRRPNNSRRAYYIDDERFTPSQFKRPSKPRKIEAMVQWFHANFEDPANRTPYNSQEGGYQWIWGGPFDADEELQDQFSDLADFDVIQAAVAEVTNDGIYEWERVADPDDYEDVEPDRGYVPPPGSLAELMADEGESNVAYLQTDDGDYLTTEDGERLVVEVREDDLRDEIERNLRVLDDAVEELQNLVRRTHNNPPALLDDLPPVGALIHEIRAAQEATRVELSAPSPNLPNVQQQASIFRRLSRIVWGAIGVVVTGVAGDVASDALKGDYTIPLSLYNALEGVANAVQAWVSYLGG
ncbi:hypothetical protein PYH37_002971 [Sinorhizobium numidicum]|uniref:Uncharacterized protein n=1 Tax=Sinorhizobium numidicum TaxID=680248 RepID=A0ABY8D6V4_9HYPH|nr:hypothetical protein [Sinorhizobium numidicum]WEX78119.1 hypothetical protein PYH37_002971 [Sinorhizobium numidicum]WEX84778.1 hypothetical protein PYH38_003684 [Sinorhizobium numidicum]